MITIRVTNGPTFSNVPYISGMNAQQAIEATYNSASPGSFTYALQYYGSVLGYLVIMINETYETFNSSNAPFYFWEYLINGVASSTGIDGTILNDNDTITFSFLAYTANIHADSTLHAKYQAKSNV